MKRTWSDGTHAVVMDPLSFIGRLCALIPPPRMHMLRFCGVLAAHNKLRAQVVPASPPVAAPPVPEQLALFGQSAVLLPITQQRQDPDTPSRPSRHAWAFLMQHVFAKDVLACPHCQGRLRIVEVAKTTESIARVLADAGIGPRAPPRPQAAWPGQLTLPLG
jgi:hypothetical protein